MKTKGAFVSAAVMLTLAGCAVPQDNSLQTQANEDTTSKELTPQNHLSQALAVRDAVSREQWTVFRGDVFIEDGDDIRVAMILGSKPDSLFSLACLEGDGSASYAMIMTRRTVQLVDNEKRRVRFEVPSSPASAEELDFLVSGGFMIAVYDPTRGARRGLPFIFMESTEPVEVHVAPDFSLEVVPDVTGVVAGMFTDCGVELEGRGSPV